MAEKKVYISYDQDHDGHYKNLLLEWDANKKLGFSFYDTPAAVSVDSDYAAAIKRVISAEINSATRLLCIVGEKTHKNHWVAWEINQAADLKKKIVAVKTAKDNLTPAGLYGEEVSWAPAFTMAAIKKAIDAP
jgi:antiphage defense system Thoeris ThsB-like protein